jgi:hypothetical protein
MRMKRLSIGMAALAICSAGVLTGMLFARADAKRFDVSEWPRRGNGSRLIEYYDPRCAASRAVHLRLAELLGEPPKVEHVLVPVAITRGTGAAPADLLCAMAGPHAFATAAAWAKRGGPDPAARGPLDERVVACARSVEQATRHTADLSPDGIVEAPIVDFGGRIYAGAGALPALEAALGALAVRR